MKKLYNLLAVALLLPSLLHAAIIPTPLPFILQNGQTADATQVMSDFNTIVTNVNANAAPAATSAQTNVTNTFTQPQVIPAGTTLGQAVNVTQLDQNTTKFVTDAGTVNAYAVAPSPAWLSYIGGSDLFVTISTFSLGTTGNVTAGSSVIASVVSTAGVVAGMGVSGTGIPPNSTVFSFVANTSITFTNALAASATATNTGVGITVSGNTNSGAATINVSALGAKNILNEDGSTLDQNALQSGRVYHLIYDGTQFLVIGKNNTAVTQAVGDNSTNIATTGYVYMQMPAGSVIDFAGTALPTGYLLCDGSSILRASFPTLFNAIGSTWGSVDATHFTLPNFLGRTTIGNGTGTTVETITSVLAAGNTVAVASNATKWITGMPVTVSAASGFTGLVNGSYFIIRSSSTALAFATTLANAQNGVNFAITGTGSATFTTTWTARTIGQNGGEESHAMNTSELLAHTHNQTFAAGTSVQIGGGILSNSPNATSSTGGNAAMNAMQPFGVVQKIIKY